MNLFTGEKTIDIFDKVNVEHKTLCTSQILYKALSAVNIIFYHYYYITVFMYINVIPF